MLLRHSRSISCIGILLLSLWLLAACASPSTPPQGPDTSEPVKLRVAVLPIMDVLPLYVADQEGLFAQHNLNVEFIPVASAPERDQVVSAGQADGMINEVLSTMFYNRDEVQVQIVRYARMATSEYPVFHILASKQSGITSVEGLKGIEIGISEGTVIEYLTERLLQAEGFTPEEIKTIAVPKIPDRLALLASGELAAGMLPDPASNLAEQQGATDVINDSSHPEYGFSTFTFRKAVIQENPDAVRGFLAAVEEAVALINADPARWNDLLTARELVPAPLIGIYQVNPYPTAGVPTQAQWDDNLAWAFEKGLLNKDVAYTDSVTAEFLPK